jgi:uncharacterized protein YihD (DUF1040 family)
VVILKKIRVYPAVPLLELPELSKDLLRRGWRAQESDLQSITFAKSFEHEDAFDQELSDLNSDKRIERIV